MRMIAIIIINVHLGEAQYIHDISRKSTIYRQYMKEKHNIYTTIYPGEAKYIDDISRSSAVFCRC